MAVRVHIHDLSKRYGEVVALDRVTIEVQPGELFFLIGPSGCGKTTLLRAVAGFVEPDAGTIRFDDRDMSAVPPHRRNTALVFQGYALWPHMTVEQNVEYGLRVRRLSAAERRRRVANILDVVRLSELARRYPNEISGGQQQRVALARAIVVEPDVLLLDEPLSNLDARLRVEMRREILRIHEQTGITTIYVTHDQKEALSMGERIAILDQGQIAQVGRPEECYRRPRTRFVARFLGEANFVEGKIASVAGDGTREVETPLGRLIVFVPGERNAECGMRNAEKERERRGDAAAVGQTVCCCFRPEQLRVVDSADAAAPNGFTARVVHTTYLGETREYELTAAGGTLPLRAMTAGPVSAAVGEGGEVRLAISPNDIVLLE